MSDEYYEEWERKVTRKWETNFDPWSEGRKGWQVPQVLCHCHCSVHFTGDLQIHRCYEVWESSACSAERPEGH